MRLVAVIRGWRLALLVAVALALPMGGGHREVQSVPDAALSAFLGAGGALADLCLDSGGHGGSGLDGHCDACQPTPGVPQLPLSRLAARRPPRRMKAKRPGAAPPRARAERGPGRRGPRRPRSAEPKHLRLFSDRGADAPAGA